MTASSSLPFHESPHRYFVMRNLYESAVKQLVLKLEILNSEFNTLYARNPIHHIESRVKSSESIVAKLQRKGSPVTLEAAMQDINDIAGVRVVCNYIDDVYRVAGMLERQEDLEIVKRQDYIKTPNYNGYRSLHLDVRVPVYLSDRTEHVVAEIQIRTIAMDFWASLEHDIHYKADRAKLPAGIDEEMFACAKQLQTMGACSVLISLGGNGALLLTEHGEQMQLDAPKGKVRNAVGAGDSMVAGFLAGYMEHASYGEAFRTAVAAGSASAFSEHLATRAEIEQILPLLLDSYQIQ